MEFNDYLVISMFLTFVGLLFTGFPVAFVLGGVAVLFTGVGYLSDLWFDTITGLDYLTLGMSVNRIYKFMDNWVLVALPMFIFMGLMLDRSGIAESLMKSMQQLFGKVRGGLAVTVTASGVGALGATLLAAANKKLNWQVIKEVMKACYNTTAYIFAIFLGATCFALVLRSLGGDEFIERALTGLPFGSIGIMAVILGCVFLLGFFLDWIEITLIVLPLVAPVISSLGFQIDGHGVVY